MLGVGQQGDGIFIQPRYSISLCLPSPPTLIPEVGISALVECDPLPLFCTLIGLRTPQRSQAAASSNAPP